MKEKLKFTLRDIQITETQEHSNKMRWTGAVTKVGVPSDYPPGGAWSRTLWTAEAVQLAIDTMKGMPVNCEWPEDWYDNPATAFTGHDSRFVIGHIEDAWVEGENLMCSGIIYKDNFYDVAYMIRNAIQALGFSVEVYTLEASYDEKYDLLTVTQLEFLGVTICWSNVAAYTDTYFTHLAATKANKKETDDMTEEQLKALLEGFQANLVNQINQIQASVVQVDTRIAELEAKQEATKVEATKAAEAQATETVTKLEAANAELKEQLEKLQAAQVAAPTAVQTAAPKEKNEALDINAELEKINKMTYSFEEKQKLKFSLMLKTQA